MNARYNAVIVGQTGVGKSSLINYLYGQKVAAAGVGKPVTKNGFHPIDFEINGLPVCLFDSWGLEVGSYAQWMSELDKEFQQRGVNESAEKWFHSVFYCIQAGGARIQDCDITIINKFIAEKYKVSVILTKCDQVDLEVEEALKAELQNQINGLSIISICSEEKRTRTGITEPFGKQDVERQAFNDFFDSLILRLPLRCKSIMENSLNNWKSKAEEKIKDVGIMGRGEDKIKTEIKKSSEALAKEMQELVINEIKNVFEMYGFFSIHLGYPPSEYNSKIDIFNTTSDINFKWWEWIIYTPIIIISLPFISKSITIDSIKNDINKYEKGFKKIIDEQGREITKMLETTKLKVTKQIK